MLEEELYYALVDDPTAEAAEGADGADGADVRPAKSKKLTKVCGNLRGLLCAAGARCLPEGCSPGAAWKRQLHALGGAILKRMLLRNVAAAAVERWHSSLAAD